MKRKPTKLNRIFASYISDSALIFRIYKFDSESRWDLNRDFSKEEENG